MRQMARNLETLMMTARFPADPGSAESSVVATREVSYTRCERPGKFGLGAERTEYGEAVWLLLETFGPDPPALLSSRLLSSSESHLLNPGFCYPSMHVETTDSVGVWFIRGASAWPHEGGWH
jgi:hypothetical protein